MHKKRGGGKNKKKSQSNYAKLSIFQQNKYKYTRSLIFLFICLKITYFCKITL